MSGSRTGVIFYAFAAVISLAGLADSTYLTVMYLTGETAVCGGSASCFQVLGSAYSRIGGIPVAAFGALAYFSAFSFATFAAFGYTRVRTFFALMVCTMFATTLWLLFFPAFLLHALFRYCLFSAALTFLLPAIAAGVAPAHL